MHRLSFVIARLDRAIQQPPAVMRRTIVHHRMFTQYWIARFRGR